MMLKYLLASLVLLSSPLLANTQIPSSNIFVTDGSSLMTQKFVVKDGEYQICKNKEGAKTLVMDGMCLWETPIEANQLLHPKSVAGLKIEKADTEVVEQYLQRELSGLGANLLRVKQQKNGLVIYYSLNQNELVSR